MVSTYTFMTLMLKACCLAVAIVLVAGNFADALRMTEMPKELQTTSAEPQMRTISLKLPLRQPVFHWTFKSKEDLLTGKLILRINQNGKTAEIVIFEDGKMMEGWEAISMPANPKAGEISFAFQSSKKYETAPNDKLELELQVKKDLDGVGSLETGILPAGTYKAQGTYSGLIDEYKVPGSFKNVSEETLAKLRKIFEHKAFLENWKTQWSLKITSDEGWTPPEQRPQMKKMLEQMRKEDEAAKKTK